MLGHLSFGVNDLDRAASFYDRILAPLGHVRVWANPNGVGFGEKGGADKLALFPKPGQATAPGPGFHLAFIAPSRENAEYSILVRTDVAGSGLGKALMTKIIGYCRAQGVGSVFGLVLRNNAKMLGLCTRLAFVRAPDDDDDDMVKVVLAL